MNTHVRLVISTLIGLAAAAALTAEAGACSRSPFNYARDPIIADFVRSAAFIDLARVQSASPLLPGAREPDRYRFESYRYVFTVIESLKGTGPASFDYIASDPIPATRPPECEGFATWEDVQGLSRCEYHYLSQAAFERITAEAESGRHDWSAFFYIGPYHLNGQGGVRPHQIAEWTSCTSAESYIEGATYLVFRDEEGQVLHSRGLNMQLIAREDDALVQAVEFFLANPSESRLPAISPRDVISQVPIVEVFSPEACSERSEYLPAITFGIDQTTGESISYFVGRQNETLCRVDDTYLGFGAYDQHSFFYVLPIRDGMVDLSGIPSQHAIEPREVPLTDVIAWLSESPQIESPQ
tara:strand:+ start:319 stop:1383 length:1065 start_codon:yes stop_codon:yes gene_type:complete